MLWGQWSSWGHLGSQGSKGHFHQKWPYCQCIHVTHYDHVTHAWALAWYPYLCCGVKGQPGVIWGHWGQKVIFTQKCYFSYILHGMVHVTHAYSSARYPLPMLWGQKIQPRVIWGHWGQRVIFTKNAHLFPLCYIAYPCNSCICISLRPSIALWGQRSAWGHFGVTFLSGKH